MKKNSTLHSKLKSYSAVAGAVAAGSVATDANAQVVYTDITDVTVNTAGMGYFLDLDNGGVVDFVIGYENDTLVTSFGNIPVDYVFAYGTATTNLMDTTDQYYVTAHVINDNINSALDWAEQGILAINVTATTTGFGDWHGVTDMYLACKFDLSGNTHYGWARLDVVTASNSFTIKDYAYNATPNTPILAGDMGATGMVSSKLENVNIFAANSMINVNMGSIETATVIVRDMMGKEVYNGQLNSSFNTINMAGIAAGIYNVTVTSEGRAFTKKVSL